MDIYKINVNVDERTLECTVRSGVLASIETGTHENKVETPKVRVSLIVGEQREQPSAWVQVSEFDGENFRIKSEGWIGESSEIKMMPAQIPPVDATLQRVSEDEVASIKTHEEAIFGRSRCCTSYGNNCYVKCCGGCCSDPHGCPGATCCP